MKGKYAVAGNLKPQPLGRREIIHLLTRVVILVEVDPLAVV